MDLKLSHDPLMRNPSCAYCGKVFEGKGVHLQLEVDHKTIHFPICQPCFDSVPRLEGTINLELGLVRVKR